MAYHVWKYTPNRARLEMMTSKYNARPEREESEPAVWSTRQAAQQWALRDGRSGERYRRGPKGNRRDENGRTIADSGELQPKGLRRQDFIVLQCAGPGLCMMKTPH